MRASPTAGWSDEEQVSWYLERVAKLEPRLAGEEVLRDLLPLEPRAVLDLGCGDGRLTALALEARPTIERAYAVDVSPPMLERARARFADDPRVEVGAWDLRDDVTSLGAFDVVLSGFAIHHLEDERKAALYGEVAGLLRPGGVFANLEIVTSATPLLHAEFLVGIGRSADDPEDRLAHVEAQLDWMRQAGMDHVDCMWRWRGMALMMGRAGAAARGSLETAAS